MKKMKYPPEAPSGRYWKLTPKSDWQRNVKEGLELQLTRSGWLCHLPCILCFSKYMVQVTLDNWTLHFQAGTNGEEFYRNETRYGDIAGKALIAFDVESGGRGITVKALRDEIHMALATAGVYETLGAENRMIEEHVVWETIDADDTDLAVQRIVEYMNAIYDIARPILERLQYE